MENFNDFIEMFMTGDYFIIFLILMFMIFVVLIMALIKTRMQYLEMLNMQNKEVLINDKVVKNKINDKIENIENISSTDKAVDDGDILDDLDKLIAESQDDIIKKDVPLTLQVNIPQVKTYDDIINDYETAEEEEAVISREELEKKTKERMNSLGLNDNQVAIQKYEEEQEKKAIISYEQLVKNANNISLTYKEENIGTDAPKVNKIEIQEKEVTPPENYLKEEEFLNILKEFRLSLE